MANLDFATVIGRFGLTVGDGVDLDEDPDTIYCDEGQITFTPLNTYTKVPGATPVPSTLGHSVITAEIDTEGYLLYNGVRSVGLVDLGSPKVNPSIPAGKATYRVDFKNVKANGVKVDFPSFPCRPVTGEVNDLTVIAPVPTAGGQAIVIGASAYQIAVREGFVGDQTAWLASLVGAGTPGLDGSNVLPTDTAIAQAVTDGVDTKVALDARIGEATDELSFAPRLILATGDAARTATDPKPLDAFGGYIYAEADGNKLYRATDPTGSWSLVHTFSGGTGDVVAVRETGDGEVIVAQGSYGIWRSAGWAANPLTATWARVLNTNAPVASFTLTVEDSVGWIGVTTYIAGSDMTNSRYVWLSKDYGQTWAIIYDKAAAHPEVAASTSHMHCIGFDPIYNATTPRIWISWHKTSDDPTVDSDPKRFITYSNDSGATWTDYSTDDMHPLFFVATEAGMVHDTDSVNYGSSLMLINRLGNTERIFRRRTTADITNLWSWGSRAIKGTDPGSWHILWRSTKPGIPGGVTTTDGVRAEETVTIPAATGADTVDAADLMLHKGDMIAATKQTVSSAIWEWSLSREPRRGVKSSGLGNIDGGKAEDQSVAVGTGSATTGVSGLRAVAVGQNATVMRDGVAIGYLASTTNFNAVAIGALAAAGQDSTVVGDAAVATGSQVILIGKDAAGPSRSTVIGYGASSISNDAVAIGHTAKAGNSTVAIGKGVTATSSNIVAIGVGAAVSGSGVGVGQGVTASGSGSVAVGQGAQSVTASVAVGQTAKAVHSSAVALGSATTTTSSNQVHIGDRHFELAELATDPNPATVDSVRFYARDDGSGKTQLVAKFNSGAVQVIAVQP